jgi:serine/threonine-protein kinase
MTGYQRGDLLDDRYEVTGVLGRGGHGVVYAAEDTDLGAPVAIKCLDKTLAAEPGFKTRMHREARVMGKLSGTSAAQIFAFNKAKDGTLYIVMELLKGRDLEGYLGEIERHGARIQLLRLIELLGPIAHTLDVAHGLDVIHRDLKPGNIFVLDDLTRGGVRLLDFGLAKDLRADALTAEGMIAGSPSYIAPEIWMGKAHQVDLRIDVYSFGAVVFRALAGKPPFDGKQPLDRLLIQVTRGDRPSLRALRPDLPPTIDTWVQKALAIDKNDRFPSVGKLWSSLRDIASMPVEQVPESRVAPWNVEVDVEIDVEVESLRAGRLPR